MQSKEFAQRRQHLLEHMGEGAIAILPTAPERVRNRDVLYPFRPDSDFYYLTGFAEPEAVLVLVPGREHGESILFCRERDPDMETWNGLRAGPDGVRELCGVDDAFPIDDIDDILPGLLERTERVFYTMGNYADFDTRLVGWMNQLRARARSGVHMPGELVSLEHVLHDMRLIKSRAELAVMRRAAELTARAHEQAMRLCRPGLHEYQLQAAITGLFENERGTHAYPPIVGGGANGCILHYIDNAAPLNDGELVLIDAGAELDYYAADVTRTFPVNGRFTAPQRDLYEVVLAAQKAAIEAVRVGNHWNMPHEAALNVLSQGLIDLKLLAGPLDRVIEEQSYRRFFMHRTGHWLGMDVHDVGDYRIGEAWRVLEPGMVMTIEPGLYVRAADDIDERWWNIGIRIEDDVAVNRKGPQVLSGGVLREIEDIEAVVGTAAAS